MNQKGTILKLVLFRQQNWPLKSQDLSDKSNQMGLTFSPGNGFCLWRETEQEQHSQRLKWASFWDAGKERHELYNQNASYSSFKSSKWVLKKRPKKDEKSKVWHRKSKIIKWVHKKTREMTNQHSDDEQWLKTGKTSKQNLKPSWKFSGHQKTAYSSLHTNKKMGVFEIAWDEETKLHRNPKSKTTVAWAEHTNQKWWSVSEWDWPWDQPAHFSTMVS